MAAEIISKRCSKCKEIKPLSEFYKDRSKKEGHRPDCKICCLEKVRNYQQSEKEEIARKSYECTEKGKLRHKHYRQTSKCKVVLKRFHARHPNQRKAVSAVNNAIRDGKLPHPDTKLCHYCPKPAQQYHHHLGYAPEHWLNVVSVCVPCHSDIPK